MIVRPAAAADRAEWLRMRCALWPDHTAAEHEAEMAVWLSRDDTAVFVCARDPGGLCGFSEASVRSYADGCETSPVAYLEG